MEPGNLSQSDVAKGQPYLSVVVPVFNEEESLAELNTRLLSTLKELGKEFEVLYVDDGSLDSSMELLKEIKSTCPYVRIIEFSRNFGQHAAVMAGFSKARGQIVVTLDADLQNPPEEIHKLLECMEEGYDVVTGVREQRQDSIFRKVVSRWVNWLMCRSSGLKMSDFGCMLAAYRAPIARQIARFRETSTFVPALAMTLSKRVAEVRVSHNSRSAGQSKYGLRRLIRLNFDLMTGFSLLPVQMVGLVGVLVSVLGLAFGVFLFLRRMVIGPEAEGIFTLFAILFVFMGLGFLALSLLGQYLGRIYFEVRRRPRYIIRKIYD